MTGDYCLLLPLGVPHLRHDIVLFLEDVVSDPQQIRPLKISVEIHLDDAVADGVGEILLRATAATVEDEIDGLVFLSRLLVLDILLMLLEEFRVEFDVARLVDAVDVAEAGSDGEVGARLGKCGPDVVDVFGLGVERVVVDVLVVDAVFLAAGDADFLSIGQNLRFLSTVELLTISSHCFIGAARFRYLLVVSMFQSTGSSDKSIMCEENNGSPCSLKYFSSASNMPSSHGSSFFAQWSVCMMTGMP